MIAPLNIQRYPKVEFSIAMGTGCKIKLQMATMSQHGPAVSENSLNMQDQKNSVKQALNEKLSPMKH